MSSYVCINREEIPDWIKEFVLSSDTTRVARVELNVERDPSDVFHRLKNERSIALRTGWQGCRNITHRSDIQEEIVSLPSEDWTDYNKVVSLYDVWPETAEEIVRCARKIKGERTLTALINAANKRIDVLNRIDRYIRYMFYFRGDDRITDDNNDSWELSNDNILKSYIGDFLREFRRLSEEKQKSELLIELSRQSINDSDLWYDKINYMGNDHSCWKPGRSFELSSEWFGAQQERGNAFAVYFYSPEVQSGYGIDGFGGFGRLWAINNSDGSDIQYINPYSNLGGSLSSSSLLDLIFPSDGYRIDYIDHCNSIIYINGTESYHAIDNYDLSLIPQSITEWIACRD